MSDGPLKAGRMRSPMAIAAKNAAAELRLGGERREKVQDLTEAERPLT